MKDEIRRILSGTGAVAVGFAKAEPADIEWRRCFDEWLRKGWNAGMEYMRNHGEIRQDPTLLMEGTKTVISMAYGFNHRRKRTDDLPLISLYAYGEDYHDSLRKLIFPAIEKIKSEFGGNYRICIDSAPIPERYWAMKSGIGIMGMNGNIIVKGYGSMVILVELLTDIEISPDIPSSEYCDGCGLCRKACPTGAIGEKGFIDCRRCLSYLTIEHRGEWTSPEAREAVETPEGRRTLFGCDRCLSACPHNRFPAGIVTDALQPEEFIYKLGSGDILEMTKEQFSSTFRGMSIKRAGFAGMTRNAANIDITRTPGMPE